MGNGSLVSIVIIFLNAERFIEEAIESVLAQTYQHWELLLVDDGSTDASTKIAQRYATQDPERVRYLEHCGHQNYGKGASRNLGIRHAQGEYMAFLDADDVWLPDKLAEQVAILDSRPEAGMVYGNTLYWHSWTGKPEEARRDYTPPLGVHPDTLVAPPQLLSLFLRGKAAVPCTCSLLVKRSVVSEVGGFDETYVGIQNIYEDQAFYAKVCLRFPVHVSGGCSDWYRQHPDASMASAEKMGHLTAARAFFLRWLQGYLVEQGERDPDVWQALHSELWRIDHPGWLPSSRHSRYLLMWAKKWLLRLEERALPASLRRRLWSQERAR